MLINQVRCLKIWTTSRNLLVLIVILSWQPPGHSSVLMAQDYMHQSYRGYGYDVVITNGQSLEGYLKVDYDVLNKKRIANQLEGVKVQSDSIRYAKKLSLFDLDRSITDQYLLAYASQEQQVFNMEVVALLEKEEVLLRQLTRSNIYKQSEYLTFLVTLQQQQLAMKQAELQHQNDYATLAYLSGIKDTTRNQANST